MSPEARHAESLRAWDTAKTVVPALGDPKSPVFQAVMETAKAHPADFQRPQMASIVTRLMQEFGNRIVTPFQSEIAKLKEDIAGRDKEIESLKANLSPSAARSFRGAPSKKDPRLMTADELDQEIDALAIQTGWKQAA